MLPKPETYDDTTRDEAQRWLVEQHPNLEPGPTRERLLAEACAHFHLLRNDRWKP